MTDRTTKILLAMIALGIWANLVASYELRKGLFFIQSYVSSIDSSVSSIDSNVGWIARGTCRNSKIC